MQLSQDCVSYLLVDIHLSQQIFTCFVFFISVSAKGFYKSQDVIDFLCETLEVSTHQLENPRFQFDRRRFEKAIHGIINN